MCVAPTVPYQPRASHLSALHEILLDHHEKFESVYDERYSRRYGPLRPQVGDAFRRFLDCGVLAHGFLRVRCRSCGHEMQVPWSCKRMTLCPGCGQRRCLEFGTYVDEAVLEAVPYRHVVFTMPRMLRPTFLRDPSMLGDLVRCAWQTLRAGLRTALGQPSATPGAIGVVATAGDLVNAHVHVHAIVSCGAWMEDEQGVDTFLPWPPHLTGERLEELFRRKLLSLLLRRRRISESTVERLLKWSRSGFSAWLGAPIEPEQKESRQRLARYLVRPVVSLERLTYDAARCRVEIRSDARGERRKMSALDFVAELSVHVPDRGRHSVHYFGRCSSRSRGKRLRALAQAQGGASDSSSSLSSGVPSALEGGSQSAAPGSLSRKAFRRSWAELLKKVWNIDTLVCPKCHSGMYVVSAITQPAVAERILRHLGLFQHPRAPNPHDCSSEGPVQLQLPWSPVVNEGRGFLDDFTPAGSPDDADRDASGTIDDERDPRLDDDWPTDPPFADD